MLSRYSKIEKQEKEKRIELTKEKIEEVVGKTHSAKNPDCLVG